MKKKMYFADNKLLYGILGVLLTSCAQKPFQESSGHLQPVSPSSAAEHSIPPPALDDIMLPAPEAQKKEAVYTVVVHDLPVGELLFALARDAKKNIDIAPGISGNVTLNAIDQTLTQILERLKRQVDLRYRIVGDTLVVSPDTPYFVQYKVPYINMERSSTNEVSIATKVASTGSGTGNSGSGSGGGNSSSGGGSNSSTKVSSKSVHQFWRHLVSNLRAILRDQDSIQTGSQSQSSGQQASGGQQGKLENSIVAHQEAGIISIRATERKHRQIAKYIANVVEHATRQVLIEATVVEVALNDQYETGVDWSVLVNKNNGSPAITLGQSFQQLVATGSNVTPVTAAIAGRDLLASVKMLDTFGNTRVLSSPKLMVLNNQTAVLKVVKNQVYFTMTAEQSQAVQGSTLSTIETQVHTVPVGLVMSVTPQINENEDVIINVRPTISRQTGVVADPNPAFKQQNITSEIPVIEVREMESVLRVHNGDIAVIGGLMEDNVNNQTEGTPGLSRVPYLDNIFSYKNKNSRKTELVIFIRPRVIKSASIKEDLSDFNRYLTPQPVKFEVPRFR